MGLESDRLVEYLKKQGQANTFKLARVLGIDRHKILDIVKELEKKQAVEFKHGNVIFLRFPKEAKKPKPIRQPPSKRKKKTAQRKKPKIFDALKNENKGLQEKILELEAKIKRQQKRLKAKPKIIRKTVTKRVSAPPRIITRTIIRKVPVKIKKKKPKKRRIKPKPKKFNISRYIPKLKKIKIKKPKFNFKKIIENIKKIHIPEKLK